MLQRLGASLLVILISLSNVLAQNHISKKLEEAIQSRLENQANIGIAIGIIDEGGMHYYNYGVKSLESKEPIDEYSIFEIGSISKTFTGIILAEMVLQGKMKLDDPVQKYLPDGVTCPTYDDKVITVGHLINHTSALPRMPDNFNPANPSDPYVDYTEELMYEFLNSCKLERAIGSEYEYSNFAMALIGHLLATQNNMSFEDLMVKTIAGPLAMENTRVVLSENMQKNLAIGHNGSREVSNWNLGILAGAGGIRSNAVDMLKYVSANMGKKELAIYPAMELSHINTTSEEVDVEVGLAWHLSKLGDKNIVSHGGATGGYQTYAAFVKGGDMGVVVLSNSNNGVSDIALHILDSSTPLEIVKPSISAKLMEVVDEDGVEKGIEAYWDLKKNKAGEYDFSESELNNLGYHYLGSDKTDIAIAIFDLNVKAYPEAFNVYDSRGEAHLKNGNKEKAIADYKKSVEINPGNQNGIDALKKMGVDVESLTAEFKVEEEVLETYVGEYELVPGFVVTISREGSQMNAQATGQPMFPIFAKAENVFYFKVVPAELTFNKGEDGVIESVTLFQNGQKMTGKKK